MKKIVLVLLALVAGFVVNVAHADTTLVDRHESNVAMAKPSADLTSFTEARLLADSSKIDVAINRVLEFPFTLQVVAAGLAANPNLSAGQKEKLKTVRLEMMGERIQTYIRLKLGQTIAQR